MVTTINPERLWREAWTTAAGNPQMIGSQVNVYATLRKDCNEPMENRCLRYGR